MSPPPLNPSTRADRAAARVASLLLAVELGERAWGAEVEAEVEAAGREWLAATWELNEGAAGLGNKDVQEIDRAQKKNFDCAHNRI